MPNLLIFDYIKQEVESIGFNLISTEYTGAHYPLTLECPNGHSLTKAWTHIKGRGFKCRQCLGISDVITTNSAITLLKTFNYELLSESVTSTSKSIKYKCDMGHIGSSSISGFKKGKRCKKCYHLKRVKVPEVLRTQITIEDEFIAAESIEYSQYVTKTKGIYQIICKSNGKSYIGSAGGRTGFLGRWKQHLDELIKQNHHSLHLQRAWDKYGADNLYFKVIEEILDTSTLVEREQYWIDFYKSYQHSVGFNISPTAGSSLGTKRTAEQVEQMRLRRLGKKSSEETKKKQSESLKKARAHEKVKNLEAVYTAMESLTQTGRLINITNIVELTSMSRPTIRSYCKEFSINLKDYRKSLHPRP